MSESSLSNAPSIGETEAREAGEIKALIIEAIRPSVNASQSNRLLEGLSNFQQVEPKHLHDLFVARARFLGLQLGEYVDLLRGAGNTDIYAKEVGYFTHILATEGTTGVRPIPLECFLERSSVGSNLEKIFSRRLQNGSRIEPLNFRLFALGDISELHDLVELVDKILTNRISNSAFNSFDGEIHEKNKLADNLNLYFRLYDKDSDALRRAERTVDDLGRSYPWFQGRSRISFCNILDPTLITEWGPDGTAAIFVRNIFGGRTIYPRAKHFIDASLRALTPEGILLTDADFAIGIQVAMRKYPPLQQLKLLYKEDRYSYDVQRSAVVFSLEKS